MHPYPATIEQAAKLLDQVKPGWEKKIDLDTFDMNTGNKCVLGQLYGGRYSHGLKELFGVDYFYPKLGSASQDTVFGNYASNENWIKEIKLRLKTVTFGEALQAAIFDGRKITHPKMGPNNYIEWYKGLKYKSGSSVEKTFLDEYKAGWTILPKEITLADLKPGQKFKIVNAQPEVKDCIYTKPECYDMAHKAIYDGYKIATIVSNTLVEIVE